MRIVTAHACERSATLHITGRLAQPVSGADELDPIFAAWRAVEMQNVILQRLSRTIGEDATAVTRQCSRKHQTGSFQMALHADFHLAVLREPRGIDDRASHTLHRRPSPAEPLPGKPLPG